MIHDDAAHNHTDEVKRRLRAGLERSHALIRHYRTRLEMLETGSQQRREPGKA